jgi:glycosyltransferase involved in cell wall biosynthesis
MILLMSTQKTIAIDARFYGEAGPGRYVKNIVKHLEQVDHDNKYLVFLRKKGYLQYTPTNTNFVKILADIPWYSWQEQISFLFTLVKARPDLLYVPHFNIPVLYPGLLVTAIADIIMHSYSTDRGTTQPKFYFQFKKLVYIAVVWWALFRSKKVIVPTNDALSDMTTFYPSIAKSKFVIAPEGVDPDYLQNVADPQTVLAKLKIDQPYLLYVGSMYEHKNVTNLLKAFKLLIDRYNYTGDLVLIGKKDKFSTNIFDLARTMGLAKRIHMPGMDAYVSDEDVISLRKLADLYVFPSLKEGFSLTPLEAQAVGLACALSDISCHREVFEDSVMYFDPKNPDDMADKIAKVLNDSDLKKSLIEKGYQQVKKYDWRKTADITHQTFLRCFEDA